MNTITQNITTETNKKFMQETNKKSMNTITQNITTETDKKFMQETEVAKTDKKFMQETTQSRENLINKNLSSFEEVDIKRIIAGATSDAAKATSDAAKATSDAAKATSDAANGFLKNQAATRNTDNTDAKENQTYIKHKTFIGPNECDKIFLLEILDESMENKNNFLYSSAVLQENKQDPEVNERPINVKGNGIQKIVRQINPNYWHIDRSELFNNPFYDFVKSVFGYRNIYMLNKYKGEFRAFLEQAYEEGTKTGKYNCAKYVFTPISDYYPYVNINKIFTNNLTFARKMDYLTENEQKYIINKCSHRIPIKIKKNVKQNKYALYKLPEEIVKKFARINRYWDDIKKQLVLNPSTGYYCYKVNEENKINKNEENKINTYIPVVCKHHVMLLENKDVNEIANECYINGVCKYCGQELIAYNDSSDFILPPAAMTLIICFAEVFKKSFSVEAIIYNVNEFIVNKLQYAGVSVYSTNECVGYTCLFLIKLCKLIKKDFDVVEYKIKALLVKLSKHLANLGKSENDVSTALENNNMFSNIDNLINRLKSTGVFVAYKEENNKSRPRLLIEDILFNGTARKVKNGIQKIYLENSNLIYATQLALMSLRNTFYNVTIKTEEFLEDSELKLNTIEHKINNSGFNFFRQSCVYYCPIHYYHEFEKNICKFCGIRKDLKNINEIYDKFANNINSITVEEPLTITTEMKEDFKVKIKRKEEETIKKIEEIKKTKTDKYKDIIKKYVLHTDVIKLEEKIKFKNNDYYNSVSIILDIPINQLNEEFNGEEDVKKFIIYVVDNNIQTEETAINNMLVYYYKI